MSQHLYKTFQHKVYSFGKKWKMMIVFWISQAKFFV